jgi:sugar transferase (PEP-CTERM/EpsH1 system associated)
LFLTHRLPYAPDRGDRIRAYNILRFLSSRADVDVVSLAHDKEEMAHAGDLRGMASTVSVAAVTRTFTFPLAARALCSRRPLTHALLNSRQVAGILTRIRRERAPDVVLSFCSGMAQFALTRALADLPLVLDMVDVDSAKWASMGAANRSPRGWVYRREATQLARFEADITRRARTTVVVNERERAALLRLAPGADVRILANGIDLEYFAQWPEPTAEDRVTFCGVFSYEPNAAGALWLLREVWPRVRASRPGARLTLVGSAPRRDLIAAAGADSSVTLTGRVPDVRPYLWNAAVAVAPLQIAQGVQTKVFEAAAAGLPSVVTGPVFEGLPPTIRQTCLVADSPDEFAARILELLGAGPAARRARARAASLRDLDWKVTLAPLMPILESAVSTRLD